MNISYSCRRMTSPAVIACLAVVVSLGCGTPTDPQTDPQDVLTVDLTVTPSSIGSGDSLLVTLTIVNPTIRPIQFSSGDSCVALPEVYSAGEWLPWDGTGLVCLAVMSTFTVPALGVLTRQFPLVAFLQESTAPWDYVVPPTPGMYDLVMSMHVELPDIERQFVVTETASWTAK